MSKCYITQKTTLFGNKRSHAMNATRKTWKANLQKIRIIDEKGQKEKSLHICTCIKKTKITKSLIYKTNIS